MCATPQPGCLPVPGNILPAAAARSRRGLRLWLDLLLHLRWRGDSGEGGGQDSSLCVRPPRPGLPVQSLPLPQRGRPAGARHQDRGGREGGEGAAQQGLLRMILDGNSIRLNIF